MANLYVSLNILEAFEGRQCHAGKLSISLLQYCQYPIYSHPWTKDIDAGLNTVCLMALASTMLGSHFILAVILLNAGTWKGFPRNGLLQKDG